MGIFLQIKSLPEGRFFYYKIYFLLTLPQNIKNIPVRATVQAKIPQNTEALFGSQPKTVKFSIFAVIVKTMAKSVKTIPMQRRITPILKIMFQTVVFSRF